jgi:hypothetical protein
VCDAVRARLPAEAARPKLYMRRHRESIGIGLRMERENMFPSVRAAVEAMLAREGRTDGIPADDIPNRSFRAFFDNQRPRE